MVEDLKGRGESGTWFNWWPGPVVTSGRVVAVLLATVALLGGALAAGLFLESFAIEGLVSVILAGLAGWAALRAWRTLP